MMRWNRYAGGMAAIILAAFGLMLQPAAAQSRVTSRFEQGLLWKIEGGGVPASYLFGTIHVDDKRATALPEPVAKSLDAAASFTMEVTFEPANLLQLADRMVYSDGRDLPGAVGEALYKKLVVAGADLGIPAELLRRFKPWAVSLLLLTPQQNPIEVLDNVLFQIASQQHKTMYQLESVEEQIAAFEGMPERDQVVLLRYALESLERMPQMTGRLIDAYLRRDLAAMWRISEESDSSDPDIERLNRTFVRRLLDERNARMVERMQPQLRAGNAFIAVGALHLYGARGVLGRLEDRGFRVTRVY